MFCVCFSVKKKHPDSLSKTSIASRVLVGFHTSCRAVPREGPVPCPSAPVQGTGEPSAQGCCSYHQSARISILQVVLASSPGATAHQTRPPTPALAMPPLKKQKAEFQGLTDLGAGASRVLPQTHSQAVCNASWQGPAWPRLGLGGAGRGWVPLANPIQDLWPRVFPQLCP